MADEDDISYMALTRGVRVLSSDGVEIGTVERVLDIPDLDLFDGIVIETPDGDRFIDSEQVARITSSAVHCTVSSHEAATLSVPDSAPTYRADPREDSGSSLTDRLKRKLGRAKWSRDHDDE